MLAATVPLGGRRSRPCPRTGCRVRVSAGVPGYAGSYGRSARVLLSTPLVASWSRFRAALRSRPKTCRSARRGRSAQTRTARASMLVALCCASVRIYAVRPWSVRTGLADGAVGNLGFPDHGSPVTAARPAPARTSPAAPSLAPATRGEHDGALSNRGSGASPDTATAGDRSGTAIGEPPWPPDTPATQSGSYGPGPQHQTTARRAAPAATTEGKPSRAPPGADPHRPGHRNQQQRFHRRLPWRRRRPANGDGRRSLQAVPSR